MIHEDKEKKPESEKNKENIYKRKKLNKKLNDNNIRQKNGK